MKIIPILYTENKFQHSIKQKSNKTSSINYTRSEIGYFPRPILKAPAFKGTWFEENYVKTVDKTYQGTGLYGENSDFLDFKKVGWENLSNEPLNLTKASKKEIYTYMHALSLAEVNDSTWVRRYNRYNVTKPLAVFHTLVSKNSRNVFSKNLEELDKKSPAHKSLDIPITDKSGKLSLDCVVFDTETTGLNLADKTKPLDRIIQIGAIQVKKGKVIQESAYNKMINPEADISEEASKVHGIKNEDLINEPTMEKVLKPFLNDYLKKENGIIVAYNSKFDMTILNNEIDRRNDFSHDKLKKKQSFKVLDPFILIQRIHPYLGVRKKLSEQYKFLFCKNLDDAHDAFADVKGTVDVLKYCLYYLDKHRKDKTKPLSLREVLTFQNGGTAKNIDIPLDNEGANSKVNFKNSYRNVAILVDNYFNGYKLTPKLLKEIAPEIGKENVNKLKGEKIVNELYGIKDEYGHYINPAETTLISRKDGVENAHYVMKKNYKKVLELYGIDAYGDKSKEEMIDFITEKSKNYLNNTVIDTWMKNPNPNDIKDGNDLPDFEISKKVLQESRQTDF